jgi:hypothetical protein
MFLIFTGTLEVACIGAGVGVGLKMVVDWCMDQIEKHVE